MLGQNYQQEDYNKRLDRELTQKQSPAMVQTSQAGQRFFSSNVQSTVKFVGS